MSLLFVLICVVCFWCCCCCFCFGVLLILSASVVGVGSCSSQLIVMLSGLCCYALVLRAAWTLVALAAFLLRVFARVVDFVIFLVFLV